MNTTNLFVELLVIGVGALIWVSLLILSIFGLDWINFNNAPQLWAGLAIPMLSVVYVLGILSDRASDYLFDKLWGSALHDEHFNSKEEYYNSYSLIFTCHEKLTELHHYGRSRLRICRGWSVNAIIIALFIGIFGITNTNDNDYKLVSFGTAFFISMAIASWWAWKKLTIAEYVKINSQVSYLEKINNGI